MELAASSEETSKGILRASSGSNHPREMLEACVVTYVQVQYLVRRLHLRENGRDTVESNIGFGMIAGLTSNE